MISTDRKIFERGSAVRARQAAYADGYDEVHILVFAGREFGEQAISGNCWAYPTRSAFKFAYPFDAARLGRFIVKRRGITDITCQDASLTAMAGLSLKRRFGLPLEIQVHEDIGAGHYAFSAANKIRKALALSHLPKADKIRVVSDKIKDYLVGALGIDASKIAVRPIEIDVGAIKGASITSDGDLRRKYPQFSKIVLMVSRFEKEKNLKLAVEAWPLALEKLPGAGLVIVGAGSLESRLKAMAARIFSSNGGIEP
ncbi:MAG: glycosyltransferase family 4 protein, partial [Patescibacteria group bacterium]|nr:glycosyltransferase family 4 protein [Patescibacteria group bacterium]